MDKFYAIVCTQTYMSKADVIKECSSDKWIPILVMRPDNGNFIVPIFESPKVACRFAKRNLPKSWLFAIMDLQIDDVKQFADEKGCEIIVYEYPRNVKDITDFDVEILEFESDREIKVH